jgi:methionine-rich copper-binding protein CopC
VAIPIFAQRAKADPKCPGSGLGEARLDCRSVTAATRRLVALVAALAIAALAAGTALGHASLVSSTPAEGSSVTASQASTVTLTFDDDLDAAKSDFQLVDAGGATVATGKVGGEPKAMTATALSLAPGAYQARWTAFASDGDLTRGIVSFTVVADGAAAAAGGASAAAPASPDAPTGSAADPSGGAGVAIPIVAGLVIVAVIAGVVLRRGRAA